MLAMKTPLYFALLLFITALVTTPVTRANEEVPSEKEAINNYKVERFYTHLTTQARTAGPGQVLFESFPGSNSNTSFLTNSLSYGIINRLQIGTAPIFYAIEEHKYNLNFKTNLVKKRYFQLGAGLSSFRFRLKNGEVQEIDGNIIKDIYVDLNFVFLALNYRDPGSRWSYGYNFSHGEARSNSSIINRGLDMEFKKRSEWALDVGYRISDIWHATFGVGEQREDLFEIKSSRNVGLGTSMTYLQNTKWLPKITYGINFVPDNSKTTLLISLDVLR